MLRVIKFLSKAKNNEVRIDKTYLPQFDKEE